MARFLLIVRWAKLRLPPTSDMQCRPWFKLYRPWGADYGRHVVPYNLRTYCKQICWFEVHSRPCWAPAKASPSICLQECKTPITAEQMLRVGGGRVAGLLRYTDSFQFSVEIREQQQRIFYMKTYTHLVSGKAFVMEITMHGTYCWGKTGRSLWPLHVSAWRVLALWMKERPPHMLAIE